MITITSKEFGKTKQGQVVTAYEMKNENGMFVRLLDFGCTIQSLVVPDKNGTPTDVVLGYDDVASYENGSSFFGATVGRYTNRIKNGHFVLEGKEYQLERNCEKKIHHLHGVMCQRMFNAHIENETVVLKYFSPDMEEGYPGNLDLEIHYDLKEDNTLEITYKATTDATTIINLTNHSYFNLNGIDGSTVLNHKLRLNSSAFTEYDDIYAQTGNIISVENTPLDFRKEQVIGEHSDDDYHQLRICYGYDHNMILDGELGKLKLIGIVKSDVTGICLEADTTEPAVQFHTGNYIHLDSAKYGKNGVRYPQYGGLCLEAQHYPDSINHPNFPNTILRPGETYNQKTILKFGLI